MSYPTLTQIVLELAESRSEYLRNITNFQQPQREVLSQQFLSNEQIYLSLVANILFRQQSVTIDFQYLNTGTFLNPVLVTPTAEQISHEVEDYMHSSVQQCSICQDDISSGGARLRVCQHSFHRSCIQTWFGASVRCPICRRDIREGPANQTSFVSTGISSPEQNQWGGEDIEE